MSVSLRRVCTRLAVVVGALALPLMAAGAAQAALAGANPFTTTGRPDLSSVAITSGSSAQFCFDKTITFIAIPNGFYLGGYRSDVFQTAATSHIDSNAKCVDATGFTGDLASYSFGQVAEHAVRVAGGADDVSDSTALSGSTSHNGTRGLTTSPDLQSVGPAAGTQTLAFKFDQQVNGGTVAQNGFHYETGEDTQVDSISAAPSATDPTVVIAQFPAESVGKLVANATRAYVDQDSLSSAADSTQNNLDSANITPGGLVGNPPILEGATLVDAPGAVNNPGPGCPSNGTPSRCVAVDFSFSVAVKNQRESDFKAVLSDGSHVNADNTTITGNVVRAFFNDANYYDEHLVKAYVFEDAVQASANNAFSEEGSAPIGGNTGAFSEAFTTGPDAVQVSFDTSTNNALVLFDQRVFCANKSNFDLLDTNGNDLGSPDTVSSGVTDANVPSTHLNGCDNTTGSSDYGNPGPAPSTDLVTLHFNASTILVGSAHGLEIGGPLNTGAATQGTGNASVCSAQNFSDPFDVQPADCNVQQLITPTSTGAFRHLRMGKVRSHRHLRHHHNKR